MVAASYSRPFSTTCVTRSDDADVLERVAVDHHEVGELAGLERADVAVETEVARAVRASPRAAPACGVMPPCTIIHISQCAASPSRWPCAPMLTLTPRLLQLVRRRAPR